MRISISAISVFLVCIISSAIWAPHVCAQNETVAQVMRASEDARMFDQMKKVSDYLNYQTTVNHRFPEYGDEMKLMKERLNQLVPNPPYDPHALRLQPGLDADPLYAQPDNYGTPSSDNPDTGTTLDRINLSLDLSMTELEIQGWCDDPPYEWRAAPGTISAISNQQNLYIVWGAGADGLPLRDPYSKRVLMIIERFHGLYDTQD